MRVHLKATNEILESTTIAEWPLDAQVALFKTVDSGVADELRFEAELQGQIRWVYIRVANILFVSFDVDEIDLKDRVLVRPTIKPIEQTDEV